jgi:hypothetical protein
MLCRDSQNGYRNVISDLSFLLFIDGEILSKKINENKIFVGKIKTTRIIKKFGLR